MDTSKQLENVLSFCTGYGGIERGLELAGVATRTLAYVEIEAFACANLVAKMETGALVPPAPIWSNLKTFPSQIFRGRVDILTGGYPCQPFSAAGKRLGKDDPRHLWPYIREHIETIRPVRCFFENVEGHISLGLREVIEDLERLGYATTWGVFSAAEVGAPHQRKRVYILAHSQRELRWEGIVGKYGDQSDERGEATQRRNNPEEFGVNGQAVSHADSRYSTECSEELADSISPRSQVGLSGQKRPNQEGNAGITDNCSSKQSGREIGMSWLPEPNVGRVVDGCADRVDRIRLLGNGVVPQTAAKAWAVLNQQILER